MVDAVEWACVLCGHRIHFWMIQKAAVMGNWWLAASLWNVPAYTSHLVQSFLVNHQITQVTQLPYSLDLVPCDLWFFPKLKSPLKGKRVQTTNERDSGKYNRAADGDWENCMRSQGAYFEGNWGVIEKEWILTTCDSTDGPREYYAQWNVSHRRTSTMWFHLSAEPKEQYKRTNKTETDS